MRIYERLRSELKMRSLRITSQREAVLSIFVENNGKHLTPDEVYERLAHRNSHISKATIYRSIELLEEMGFLSKINFGDGLERYELKNEHGHQHHHVVCTECGQIYALEEDLLDDIEKIVEKRTNFTITDHQLNFYGLCPKCRARHEEESKESQVQKLQK